jgi:tetratricopeptide (TPR) repeat protein
VPALVGRGGALLALGRAEEAEAAARAALAVSPAAGRAHLILWDALEAQARWPELEAAALAVLAVQPEHADARARVARARTGAARGGVSGATPRDATGRRPRRAD